MASLKEVKVRITSVMSTQQITKAMKMVAAAKLRKSQERILQMRPYARKLGDVLSNLTAAYQDGGPNWYSITRPETKILIVAISSDRGLCGSFNSNIFKATLRLIQERYSSQQLKGNVTILPIGRKAFEFFGKRNIPMVKDYWEMFHAISFERISAAGDYLIDSYKAGTYDKIEIVYNEFKNVATQVLQSEQFLPVVAPKNAKASAPVDYIFQPNLEEIISGIIPKSLKTQLFKAVLDSNASENGARMTAMDKATENAGELIKDLKLTYNRTRQAAITKEILEIVAGAEALKAS
jgi:F-type H+-transporting ATPase subunit gamma